MDGAAQDLPGVRELAASIVSSVKNEVIESSIGQQFDVAGLIDEAVLLQIAKDEIDKALPPILEVVIDRVREDLQRGLNRPETPPL